MSNEDGEHRPSRGDKIWSEHRKLRNKQPNGYIYAITEWGSNGMVLVKWHGDNYGSVEEYEDVATAELDGKYHGQQLGYLLYADDRHVWRKN